VARQRSLQTFIKIVDLNCSFIIVMIRWTGLAPWEFEIPFPGSRTSTFLWQPEEACGAAKELVRTVKKGVSLVHLKICPSIRNQMF